MCGPPGGRLAEQTMRLSFAGRIANGGTMPDLAPPPPCLLEGAALFLDFDGTLVELAETPDAIRVPPALGALFDRLRSKLGGRLAIVSGRALADLERHLPRSDVVCAGSHGLELRL